MLTGVLMRCQPWSTNVNRSRLAVYSDRSQLAVYSDRSRHSSTVDFWGECDLCSVFGIRNTGFGRVLSSAELASYEY